MVSFEPGLTLVNVNQINYEPKLKQLIIILHMKLLKLMLLQDKSPPYSTRKNMKQFLTIKQHFIMKKIKLITALTLLLTVNANSQITKGNWMVGGSGSFYSYQLIENSVTNSGMGVELRPNIGFFIKDKFAIGITPLFAYSKPENGSSVTSYGIGPYIRYYLLKPESRVNILTQVEYAYSGSNNSNDKSTALDFKVGPAFYFNSSVALEMTLNYNLNKLNSTTNYNIFSLGLGFQIHLEK